uniref:MFS domain-containing protein n=1 Tax=Rhabditophanes sp. KR3021 TaxID=114890 RepID=A0AC35TLH8_9BILA
MHLPTFEFGLPKKILLITILHGSIGSTAGWLNRAQGTLFLKIEAFFRASYGQVFSTDDELYYHTLLSLYMNLNVLGTLAAVIINIYLFNHFSPQFFWLKFRNVLNVMGCFAAFISLRNNDLILNCVANVIIGVAGYYGTIQSMYLPQIGLKQQETTIMLYSSCTMHLFADVLLIAANDKLMGSYASWSYLYLMTGLISTIYLSVTWNMPESGKYLYLIKNDAKEAAKSLKYYNGQQIDTVQIFQEYDEEDEKTSSKKHLTFSQILKQQYYRKVLLIVAVLVLSSPLSVSLVMDSYGQLIVTQFTDDEAITSYIALFARLMSLVISFFAPKYFKYFGIRRAIMGTFYFSILGWVFFILADLLPHLFDIHNSLGIILVFFAESVESIGTGLGKGNVLIILLNIICPESGKNILSQIISPLIIFSYGITAFVMMPLYDIIGTYLHVIKMTMLIIIVFTLNKLLPDSDEKLYNMKRDRYHEI